MSEIRRKAIAGLKVGDSFTVTRTFTEEDMLAFAGITRDYNPVHFDDRFAAVKKFNGRICHGLMVAGMLTEIGGQCGWLASGMNFRFKKPVYFNDTITCLCTLTTMDEKNRAEAEAVFTNQHGEVVLEASLFGVLPNARERLVLKDLLDSEP